MTPKKILPCLIIVFLFIFLLIPLQNNIFSVQFGDEDDNFVIAQWILDGKKLYQDVFYNHQPLPILAGALLQKIYRPTSIFQLVKYQRISIFIYSATCSLILYYLIGWPAIIFIFLFETTKFALLGNLFLAETIAIYPIIFIIGIIHEVINKSSLKIWKISLFAASLVLIQLTLLPLTSFTILAFILLIINLKLMKKILFFKLFLLFGFLTLLAISPFISFIDYFKDTFFANILYVVPYEANYTLLQAIQRILFRPLLALFLPNQTFFLILKIACILYLFSVLALLKKKKWRLVLIFYFLLTTTNFRPVEFGTFRNGFHLLPFYATLIWITVLQTTRILKTTKNFLEKKLFVSLILFFSLICLSFGAKEFLKNNTSNKDFNINYSHFFQYGEAIRLISTKKDNLLTIPAASLIYAQSRLTSNSKYFFLLGFMRESKPLSEEMKILFEKNPPEFLYSEESQNTDQFFKNLSGNYFQIVKNSKPSYLFISKNKLKEISDTQWEEIKRLGFVRSNN